MMFYYLRKYPFSLALIAVVIYLSFFKPPKVDEALLFPGFDKVVHFCMYAGVSGMLWLALPLRRTDLSVRWFALS